MTRATPPAATDLDSRLRRLERITLAAFAGLFGAPSGGAAVDFRPLKQQATQDAAAIAAELAEPPIETRAAS